MLRFWGFAIEDATGVANQKYGSPTALRRRASVFLQEALRRLLAGDVLGFNHNALAAVGASDYALGGSGEQFRYLYSQSGRDLINPLQCRVAVERLRQRSLTEIEFCGKLFCRDTFLL